jgi:hypothetical protein
VKQGGDPVAPTTVVVGLVGAVLIFVVIVLLQALFQRAGETELARRVTSAVPAELESLRADQLGRLNGYRWVNPQKGIVAVPIDEAMELTVRDAGAPPPAAK